MNRQRSLLRRSLVLVTAVGLASGLAACKSDDRTTGGGTDAGMIEVDSGGGGTDTGVEAACWESAAAMPWGTSVGRKLEPFTLQRCSDETDYAFYNDEFCDSTFTVISIAAGWCPPCMAESSELTERVTEAYADQGVRVIQILIQDAGYNAPTDAFCDEWVSTYGLTNVELIDPDQVTQIYFPDNALPSTIIVDREGVIRFRENGATEGLVSLTAKLDELLAGM